MLDENEDFTRVQISETSGQTSYDYALSISSAKEIAMLNGGDKGKQARRYFIEMEKIAKDLQEINPRVPKTFREALLLAAEQQEVIEKQAVQIEVMKPKEQFFDQVTGSSTAFDMADVAKVCNLGVGRNTLFQFLREQKILRDNKEIDAANTMTGFRSYKFDPDKGFALNDKWMKMKGVCLHHDAGVLGAVAPKEVLKRRLYSNLLFL